MAGIDEGSYVGLGGCRRVYIYPQEPFPSLSSHLISSLFYFFNFSSFTSSSWLCYLDRFSTCSSLSRMSSSLREEDRLWGM